MPLSPKTSEFREPWRDPTRAIVLDPYQANALNRDRLSSDSRVVAIIHQATKGSHRDTEYARRKEEAKRRGYKWGSYHLGLPGDPVAQADFYLSMAKPEEDEVMALDIEGLNPRKDMSLANARRFILRVKEKTGRYPLLYANDVVARRVSRRYGRDEDFSEAAPGNGASDAALGVPTRAEAYFIFNDGKDDFIFKLTDRARIQEARDILSGKEKTKKHVMGLVVPRHEDYNRAWHYHLDPASISFFQNAIEVCDSTVRFVEDHLTEVGGSFLPGNRWCPWSSKLVREIPRPQGTGRRSVRGRHP